MRVEFRAGVTVEDILAEPLPDVETLLVQVGHTGKVVSLGRGRYMPDKGMAVYRDPVRPFDAVCTVATPVGDGRPRCTQVTFLPRGDGLDGGDLRLPLAGIVEGAVSVLGTGSGPDLPAGSVHPTSRVAFQPFGGRGQSKRRRDVLDDRRLAEVALVYGRALREGRSTRRAVAETFGKQETTAAEWIKRAREAGMLPKVHGRRRLEAHEGQPTRKALRLLGIDTEDAT